MKIKIVLLAALMAVFSSPALAQSVVVTPRKVVYKRTKPISEYKKDFTIIHPRVKGLTPALNKKVETNIGYEKNFDFKIKEEISEIQWLYEASYEVDYNKNGILGMTLTIEGSGAYPSGSSKPVIINLKNGEKIRPIDVFTNLSGLAAKIKIAQQAEVKQAIIDIKKENPEEENPAQLFESTDFTVKDMDRFSVSDKGVTFWYDYGFPHVIQAWQPEGRYFFSWAELKPFIKPGGLLARFVR